MYDGLDTPTPQGFPPGFSHKFLEEASLRNSVNYFVHAIPPGQAVSRRESRRYWAASAGNPAGIRQFRRDSAIPPRLASPGGICIPVPKHRESPLRWPRSGMKSVPPGCTPVPPECKIQAPSAHVTSAFNVGGIPAGISLVPPGFPPGFRSISAGFPHL